VAAGPTHTPSAMTPAQGCTEREFGGFYGLQEKIS